MEFEMVKLGVNAMCLKIDALRKQVKKLQAENASLKNKCLRAKEINKRIRNSMKRLANLKVVRETKAND